jgi:hypothetical protein
MKNILIVIILVFLLAGCAQQAVDPTPTMEIVTLEPTIPATDDIDWSSHFICAMHASGPEKCEVNRNPYLKGPYSTVVIEDTGGGAKRNAMVPTSYGLTYEVGQQGAAFEVDCTTSGGYDENTSECVFRMSDRDGRMGYVQEVAVYADSWYVIAVEGTANVTGRLELNVRVDDVYYEKSAQFSMRAVNGRFQEAYVFYLSGPQQPGTYSLDSENVFVTAEFIAPYAVQGNLALNRISVMSVVPGSWGTDVATLLD